MINCLLFSYYDTVQVTNCQLRRSRLKYSGCLWYAEGTNLAEHLGIKNTTVSSVRHHLGILWLHEGHSEEQLNFHV